MRRWLLTTVLLLPVMALAGNTAEVELVGFSDDGSLFAWYDFGVVDGAGWGYANLFVIDEKGASLSRKPVAAHDGSAAEGEPPTQAEVLAQLKAKTAAVLKAKKLTDPGVELYTSGTARSTSFTLANRPAKLTIKTKPWSDDESGFSGVEASIVLTIQGKERVLLAPTKVGASINLSSVRLSKAGTSLAVIVKYDSVNGFEGADRRVMGMLTKL
ncbi:MAG: DUF2259 domain-containing protein [Archangium sp.]|nr:DUF2259 domain-containing protein [Archangium sp.]